MLDTCRKSLDNLTQLRCWIVFYINSIAKISGAVLSPPLTLFALLSAATF